MIINIINISIIININKIKELDSTNGRPGLRAYLPGPSCSKLS